VAKEIKQEILQFFFYLLLLLFFFLSFDFWKLNDGYKAKPNGTNPKMHTRNIGREK
jgi:hypothetical protein